MRNKALLLLRIAQGIFSAVALVFLVTGWFVLQNMQLTFIGMMLLAPMGILICIRPWLERKKKDAKDK